MLVIALSVDSGVLSRVNCDDFVGEMKGHESVTKLIRQRSMLDQEESDLKERRLQKDAQLSGRGQPHHIDGKPSPGESELVGLFKELL